MLHKISSEHLLYSSSLVLEVEVVIISIISLDLFLLLENHLSLARIDTAASKVSFFNSIFFLLLDSISAVGKIQLDIISFHRASHFFFKLAIVKKRLTA